MKNRTHLPRALTGDDGISRLMPYFGRLYVRRFNYRHTRIGALFDGRYKSSTVQDNQYLLNCLQYMALNSVRVGMVKDRGAHA